MAPTNRKAHYECHICDQVCTYKYNLAKHLKNFHDFEKVLFCTEKDCEAVFKTISDHGDHMKNEHEWKSQCEICGKVFKRPQNKWAHKKTLRSNENEVEDAKTSALVYDYLVQNSMIEVANEFRVKCGPFENPNGIRLEDIMISRPHRKSSVSYGAKSLSRSASDSNVQRENRKNQVIPKKLQQMIRLKMMFLKISWMMIKMMT